MCNRKLFIGLSQKEDRPIYLDSKLQAAKVIIHIHEITRKIRQRICLECFVMLIDYCKHYFAKIMKHKITFLTNIIFYFIYFIKYFINFIYEYGYFIIAF